MHCELLGQQAYSRIPPFVRAQQNASLSEQQLPPQAARSGKQQLALPSGSALQMRSP
jgi:hypothetical protein